MPRVATKLFREPEEAKKAIDELKANGYKADEVLVVASAERSKKLGSDFKTESDVGKLAEIGVPEATVNYFKHGVAAGGVVVGVQADEARVAQAQQLLRTVPVCSCDSRICGTSPGFQHASRMTATNPIDAPMSGDFRRY